MKIYSLAFLLLLQFPLASQSITSFPTADNVQVLTDSVQTLSENKPRFENIIFKSADDGQTWQDISEGLPQAVREENGIDRDDFFADDRGFYLSAGNWIYHNQSGAADRSWNKALKSIESSGRWDQVHAKARVVSSNGVLMATCQKGIERSVDDGKTWELVISEGGVGIAIASIKGGVAAITYNTVSKTRRVRTSYDGGKTWEAIDGDLPASPLISSIIQVGENFFCGHPAGIFRSSDKGKTWRLLLPSIDEKVFNLYRSGNVIYAIPRPGGC